MAKTKGLKYWNKKLIGNGGVVNDYVKWRDATRVEYGETGKMYPVAPCITCSRPVVGRNLHAGHWISRAHKGSAYDERNIHAQCGRPCNKDRSGEPQKYEAQIIKRYGTEVRDELKNWVWTTRKWTPAELEGLYNEYKSKLEKARSRF